MADEKKTLGKPEGEKPSWFSKFIAWCKALPANIAKPFRNMANEMKRVTWPSKKKLIVYSIAVLVFMLFMMVVIGLFDLGSVTLVNAIRVGGSTQTPAENVATMTDVAETENTGAGEEIPAPTEAAPGN